MLTELATSFIYLNYWHKVFNSRTLFRGLSLSFEENNVTFSAVILFSITVFLRLSSSSAADSKQ